MSDIKIKKEHIYFITYLLLYPVDITHYINSNYYTVYFYSTQRQKRQLAPCTTPCWFWHHKQTSIVRNLFTKLKLHDFINRTKAGIYRIKHSFWRMYWCVNYGHFTHILNKRAKHFYVKFVSKMSRVYTLINSSKGMFNSYNFNSLVLCKQFQIFEKLPCTTLFEPFLAKRPRQLWKVKMKQVNNTDVILKRDVISLFVENHHKTYCHNILRE
jgi:hypothetical protein